MSKIWKIVIWVLAILAILALIAFITFKSVWDKISFSIPRLTGLDLQGLTLNDFLNIALSGTQKEVTVGIAMDIKNDSNISIPFKVYSIGISYNGETIAKSSEALSSQKFTLPAHGLVTISDTVKVILNNAGGNLLIEKLKGGKPELQYNIMFSIFGIPIPYKGDSFTW